MILKYRNGTMVGKETLLRPPGISIGRELDNDVQLLVAGVSRYHAKITFDGQNWTLADLGSTNGTRLNGAKMSAPAVLKNGDLILMGDQEICVEEEKGSKTGNAAVPAASAVHVSAPAVSVTPPVVSVSPPAAASDVTVRKIAPEPLAKVASPGAVPASGEEKNPKDARSLLESLKKAAGSGALFGEGKKGDRSAESGGQKKNSRLDGKLGNLLFCLLAAVLVVIGAFVAKKLFFGNDNSKSPEETVSVEVPMPFFLEYERLVVTRDNVFRFSLLIDQDRAEFVLDDLRFGRHFEKILKKVPEHQLDALKNRIRNSAFLKYKPARDNKLMMEEEDRRSLTVGIDGKINSVSARKDSLSRSFEDIESAIEKFAMTNDVRAAMMGVKEMKREAMKAFRNGEQCFDNRDARPENLRKAITHFKFAMEYLADFDPRPPEYREAAKKLEEARQLMQKKRKEIHDEIYRLYKLNLFQDGARRCQEIMDLIGEDDPKYLEYKEFKLEFEKGSSGKKGGKK